MAATLSVVGQTDVKSPNAGVVEAPRFSCALGGAYAAALATYGTVPILHSGAGCGMANAHGMTFAAGLNTGGAQGTTSTPCTGLVEEHVVFGGEEKLRKLIASTLELMKGQLFAVISGCVPALIGDDVDAIVKEFRDKAPIIHVKTAGFAGSSYLGYELFFEAVIDQLLEPVAKEKRLVNVFGIVPNQDVFWKGNLQVLEKLLTSIGLRVNTVFTDFEGLAALKRIPAAELNLIFSPWVGTRIARKLEAKFGTPFQIVDGVPVGPRETTKLVQSLASRFDLPKDQVDAFVSDEERRAYRYAEYFAEAFVISLPHAYSAVVADSATALGMLRYTTNELGWNPELVILTDNPPEDFRAEITQKLGDGLESVVKPKVVFEVDSHRIRQQLKKVSVQVVLASSLEKFIAPEELGAAHLSISYPVYDRVVLDRSYGGYRGGLAFVEDLTATFAGPL
jgi:nitrogenase molybdenum-iron protein beta chain